MDTSKSRMGSPGVNGNSEIWGTQASVSGCREGREENCSFSCQGAHPPGEALRLQL